MSSEKSAFSNKLEDLIPYFIMGLFILIVQAGSLWLSATDYIASQPPLDNPESVGYSIYYIVVLILFTALIIFLIKINKTFVIRGIIYAAIAVTLYYVFVAILDKAVGFSTLTWGISVAAALIFAVLLYKYPEWYIIDFAGLMISIGACAVIGVSLSYMPIIVLMVGLLIYDFISVYKTKHMLTLANGMMDLKLPILFVIPKSWRYSYIEEDFSDDDDDENGDETGGNELTAKEILETAEIVEVVKTEDANTSEITAATGEEAAEEIKKKKKKSDALFMGLGDAVIPTLLVVSANHFIEHSGWISTPALCTMIGTFVGFAALMYVVSKGNPQAGLPFLNTGAILGFAAGVLISGATISLSLGF
ncbi:presenilin family intramembrane aspartyl protease PSH [Methanimicrococcus stummii]|uniref:presenilin family intramembrane aspartyl protease PSH n=1 Tax=Methanimicrococcus stummii TaxID=3028294 RepID=UPI00292F120A|nr:presenilin family intramembrane aspartyl protease PSH [Methanimicrococcus sp. Es2]